MIITLRTKNNFMVNRFEGELAAVVLAKSITHTRSAEAKDKNKKIFVFEKDMKITLCFGITIFFLEGFYLVLSE